MKKIKILPLSLITLAMVGCGGGGSGSSSSDEDNFPTDLTYFTLDAYREAADLLRLRGDYDITGTWVGIRDYIYTDANTEGADYKRYESQLEFMVIRESSSENADYEIASCSFGRFDEIRTLSSTDLVTDIGVSYRRSAENVLTSEIRDLPSGVNVTLTSSSEFIRINDSTSEVGTMAWNWESGPRVSNQSVYCANLSNLEDSEHALLVGVYNEENNNSTLKLRTVTYPFVNNDIEFEDEINDLSHESADSSDDVSITITGQDVYGYDAEFIIERSDSNNDTVVGNVSVEVTF